MASDLETDLPRQSVFGRMIRPEEDDLSADAARSILRLKLDDKDLNRMLDLAERYNRGELTETEAGELREYRQGVLLIELLRAKARLSLKRLGLPYE